MDGAFWLDRDSTKEDPGERPAAESGEKDGSVVWLL